MFSLLSQYKLLLGFDDTSPYARSFIFDPTQPPARLLSEVPCLPHDSSGVYIYDESPMSHLRIPGGSVRWVACGLESTVVVLSNGLGVLLSKQHHRVIDVLNGDGGLELNAAWYAPSARAYVFVYHKYLCEHSHLTVVAESDLVVNTKVAVGRAPVVHRGAGRYAYFEWDAHTESVLAMRCNAGEAGEAGGSTPATAPAAAAAGGTCELWSIHRRKQVFSITNSECIRECRLVAGVLLMISHTRGSDLLPLRQVHLDSSSIHDVRLQIQPSVTVDVLVPFGSCLLFRQRGHSLRLVDLSVSQQTVLTLPDCSYATAELDAVPIASRGHVVIIDRSSGLLYSVSFSGRVTRLLPKRTVLPTTPIIPMPSLAAVAVYTKPQDGARAAVFVEVVAARLEEAEVREVIFAQVEKRHVNTKDRKVVFDHAAGLLYVPGSDGRLGVYGSDIFAKSK